MNFTISTIPLFINVGIRLVTAFIFLAFLIPLIFKEATVKNGLKALRIQLLLSGLLIFFINTVGLLIIVFRYIGFDVKLMTDLVTYLNTVGFLAYALIGLRVYTQKYSEENKRLHAKFEQIEVQEKEKRKTKLKKKK